MKKGYIDFGSSVKNYAGIIGRYSTLGKVERERRLIVKYKQ